MDETEEQAAAAATRREGDAATHGKTPLWRQPAVILLGTAALGAILFFGLGYLAEGLTHESTDDAFLDGNIVAVAPKVAGQVRQVSVTDNQAVRAGEVLAEIDPRDLQVALDQKKTAETAAEANVGLLKASVELFRTEIASAEATAKQTAAEAAASAATAERARTDLKRAEELIQNHTISPQEFDLAKTTAAAAEANLQAAREKAASDQSKVGQAQAQLGAGIKAYERAEAQARQAAWDTKAAELNLSYTRVTAPEDGYVTKKAVQNGDYVQVGQKLLALVPIRGLYVTANFKETQLRRLRPGQHAQVSIDAVAGGPVAGHVDSIMAGSGARFSLLPPENAVGNYVKVVQRIPVKIVLDGQVAARHVLGPGMSVVPSVHVARYEIPEVVVAGLAVVGALVIGGVWWRMARRGGVMRDSQDT